MNPVPKSWLQGKVPVPGRAQLSCLLHSSISWRCFWLCSVLFQQQREAGPWLCLSCWSSSIPIPREGVHWGVWAGEQQEMREPLGWWKKPKTQSDEAVGRDFQPAEWDKPHGFIAPVVGSPGFALRGDQDWWILGFLWNYGRGVWFWACAGIGRGNEAAEVERNNWCWDFGDVWKCFAIGFAQPSPSQVTVLFFHKNTTFHCLVS